ncbi:MAG: hypothetical protein AB9869_15225 [Verrucomicrobiia bacterium]
MHRIQWWLMLFATAGVGVKVADSVPLTPDPRGKIAPRPLFRDPVYDGAADSVVIWNSDVRRWWIASRLAREEN